MKNGVIIIEGHVQGLSNTRALGKDGIPVFVVDMNNCVTRYSKYCKKYFKCPDYVSDDFAEFLITLAKKENIHDWTLLPSNDHAVYTISKHKKILSEYYKVIALDYDKIVKIINKANLLSIADQCKIPIPKTEYFDSYIDISTKLNFPVLIKGKQGLSFYKETRRKAFVANDIKELQGKLLEISVFYPLDKTFVQEIIPSHNNRTISFTAFCIDGIIKSHWTGIKILEHPHEYGTATLAQSIKNEIVFEQSQILLKELNFTGVCEVEYLLDPRDNKYKLIEINPRTWLWVGLAIECGINYPLYIYNYLNNIETCYNSEYPVGLKWVNPYTNTIFGLKNLIKRKITLKKMIKLNSGKKINALFDYDDIKPFFAYASLLLTMIRTR